MNKAILVISAALSFPATSAANPYAAESAIYRVEVPYQNGNQMGFGTGVLVARDKILTNCHVVTSHPGWPRVVHRQTGQNFNVTKHYNLGNYDACVLVGGFTGTPVRLAVDISEGENVWIFGYPRGLPVVGQGVIDRYVDTNVGRSILLSAFCAPGSSGGPVINSKGELVGLNWGVVRYQTRCLSIPATLLQPFLSGS